MAAPEIPPATSLSLLGQLGYGVTIGVAGLLWVVQQIWAGRRDAKEAPKPVVLERAELADMQPVRDMVSSFREVVERLDELIELRADVEETRKATDKMTEQLDRIDRQIEIEARVKEAMRSRGHRPSED